MSTQSQEKFKEKQLIWAKLIGYPWWPALIKSIDNSEETLFTVSFIGEETHCQAHYKNIKSYDENKIKLQFQKIKKNYKSKFENSVKIAEKIKSGEIKINDDQKYINFNPETNVFMDHYDNIMKSVKENSFYNQVEQLSNVLRAERAENEFKENDISPQTLNYKDDQNMQSENICYKGDEILNNNSNIADEILLNKKRSRQTKKHGKAKVVKTQNENLEKGSNHNDSNYNQEIKNKIKKKRKNKSKKIEVHNIKIDNNSKKTENIENNIPTCIELRSPNEDCKKYSKSSINIKIDEIIQKEKTEEINEEHLKIITDLLSLFKSDVTSFLLNLNEIESLMISIYENLRSSQDSHSIGSDNLVLTLKELKDNYQTLLEISTKTRKIVKNSIENSDKIYLSLKEKENSALIKEIEKLQDMIETEISEDNNTNDSFDKENKINKVFNESSPKFKNLWNFFKQILSKELKMNIPIEFLSLETFQKNVIDGTFLIDAIQKFPNFSFIKEKEKLRTKVKLQLHNILSHSLAGLRLPKTFIKNLTIFLEMQAAQKDDKLQNTYKNTITNILLIIKGFMLFKLVSTAETGFFYVGKKSVEKAGQKLALMKFDPIINRHVLFLETKLKSKKKN